MQRRASRGTARGRLALGCGAVHACAGAIERIAAADPRSGGAAARPRRNRSRCEQQTIPRPRPNAVHIRASRTSLRWTHPCSLVRCVYGHGRSGGRMWRRRAVDVDQAAVAPDAGGRGVVIADDAGGEGAQHTHGFVHFVRLVPSPADATVVRVSCCIRGRACACRVDPPPGVDRECARHRAAGRDALVPRLPGGTRHRGRARPRATASAGGVVPPQRP